MTSLPSTVRATPCAPPPIEIALPATVWSATTGQARLEPKGVMVPRSYPVTSLATWAVGIDRRLTAQQLP